MHGDVNQSSDDAFMRFIRAVLIGAVCGAVVCLLLLLGCAFAFVKLGSLPETASSVCAIAICCVSSMFSGLIASRITSARGLLMGLAAAFVLFMVVLVAGISTASDTPLLSACLMRGFLMLISGALGGIFGVNRRQRKGGGLRRNSVRRA